MGLSPVITLIPSASKSSTISLFLGVALSLAVTFAPSFTNKWAALMPLIPKPITRTFLP